MALLPDMLGGFSRQVSEAVSEYSVLEDDGQSRRRPRKQSIDGDDGDDFFEDEMNHGTSSRHGGRVLPGSSRSTSTHISSLKTALNVAVRRIVALEEVVDDLRYKDRRLGEEIQDEVDKLERVDQEHEECLEKLDGKLKELGADLKGAHADIASVSSRVRTEIHRVDNAAALAVHSEGKADTVNAHLEFTKVGIRGEFDRVARSLRILDHELKVLRQAQSQLRQDMKGTVVTTSVQGGPRIEEHPIVWELGRRLEEALNAQHKMVQAQSQLEEQLKGCARKLEIIQMSQTVRELEERNQKLEKYVTEQIFSVKKDRTEWIVETWLHRWGNKVRLRLMKTCLGAWSEYICRRERMREALGRTAQQCGRAHVTEWVRSWWYTMQKENSNKKIRGLSEKIDNQSTQLEMLLAAVNRHERTSAEQTKQLNQRMAALEKAVESQEYRKADKQDVAESLAHLQVKLDRDAELGAIRIDVQGLKDGLKRLDDSKYNTEQGERDQKAVSNLLKEVRTIFRHHDDRLDKCALLDQMATKADAKLVEEVFALLAKQADQLAHLLAVDLERIRKAMSRFLELSPDIRKAALSVGLDPNEQCLNCRTMKRRALLETFTGADNTEYRMAPDLVDSIPEQAQRLLSDKLGMPSALATNLATGATMLSAPGAPGVPQQLRQLLAAGPGWISGRPMENRAEQEQAVPKSFFPAVTGIEAARSARGVRPTSGCSSIATSAGSGGRTAATLAAAAAVVAASVEGGAAMEVAVPMARGNASAGRGTPTAGGGGGKAMARFAGPRRATTALT